MDKRGSTRGLRGRKRESHARAALARWQASGWSQARFCQSEGIAPITLIRWRREFGGEVASGDASGRFVRVDLGRVADGLLEVELAGGIRVRIPAGFDGGDLERLLGILARC